MNLKETFEKFDGDYLKFDQILNKLSNRADLHAFIMLDKIVPDVRKEGEDIISAAEHDEIFLGVNTEKLAEVATEEDIQNLVRCGIRYNEEFESLCMFA